MSEPASVTAGAVPLCPACLSADGIRSPVIHVMGWVSAEVPWGPFVDGWSCWRCGARPIYSVIYRVAPVEDLARMQ